MKIDEFWNSLANTYRIMFAIAIELQFYRKPSELPSTILRAENAAMRKSPAELSSLAYERIQLVLSKMETKKVKPTFENTLSACLEP